LSPLETALAAAAALEKVKGTDIQVLRIDSLSILADYFVIGTGSSTTQVRAMAAEVEKQLSEKGAALGHREGFEKGGWILLDYASVIVHIFLPASRDFYSLDRLWEDAQRVETTGA